MTRTRTILAAATAVLAIALALAWPRPDTAPTTAGTPTTAPCEPPAPAARGQLDGAPGAVPLGEVARQAASAAPSVAPVRAAQGLRGRIVAAHGAVRADAWLAAVPAPAWSPLALARQREAGAVPEPFGAIRSGPAGRFELALPAAAIGVPIELWALRDGDADTRTRHAGIASGEWRELGDVRLGLALPIEGRVVDEAGRPIAAATITVWPADAEPGSAPPEAERSIRSDGDGRFRVTHLGKGMFGIAAEAPGHARCEREHQHVFDDQPNEILLTLLPGGALDGVVVDRAGAPIAGARVTGEAADPANPARPCARTDADGRFTLAGLDRGGWQVRASAPAHQTATLPHVAAGMRGVRLVLAPRASVRLRVTGADGQPLRRYDVTARPPRQQPDAALRALPPMAIGPDDVVDGACVLPGFDDGPWQLEVRAPLHAPAFSEPFTAQADAIVDVAVALRAGGGIAGMVLDAAGRPISGAAVQTQPDGFGDGELGAVFRGLQVWEVTGADGATDAAGRFALRHLAPGAYQLRVTAAGSMPSFARGLVVQEGATTPAPALRLARGCVVGGVVRCEDEAAASDVFVQVLAVAVPDLPADYAVEAAADATGRFALPLRLRPGRYAAMAGRRLPDNPFQEDADRQASRQEFTVEGARERLDLALRFPR